MRLGIVGACGRGSAFRAACDALDEIEVAAVCDTYETGLADAADRLGAKLKFTSYERMLDEANLDAVIIGTPMPLHVPQSIAALERGLNVLSEVPAGVHVEECRALTLAAERSTGIYMMAENYLYTRPIALVNELVRRGLFGKTYYAEGEYLHELKELNEKTPWRRKWQTGINGNTYPTHSLGPILQWMPGDRVVEVCCLGAGQHHRDPRGDFYENEATTVTLCKMRSGGLAKLRLDMLSDRPHAMNNHVLQGTDGAYESSRAPEEPHRVWLRALSEDPCRWTPLDELEEEYLPHSWRNASAQARAAGHGGGDYFVMADFVQAITGVKSPTVGIHEAMDMTLPGLISQDSIEQGGRPLPVPDSRDWLTEERKPPQLVMTMGKAALESPPQVSIPAGYILRRLQFGEEEAYAVLMSAAGFEGVTKHEAEARMRRVIPGGFFVVEHEATGRLVATAMAGHAPTIGRANAGVLDWVAAHPEHSGRGLGRTVVSAVMRLMVERGYTDVYLLTDDFRLPALAVYLALGWEPSFEGEGMRERWDAVRKELRPT